MASPSPVRSAESGQPAIVLRLRTGGGPDYGFTRLATGGVELYARTANDLASGVWHLLRILGHRQLATTTDWEIVPSLGAQVDVVLPASVQQPLRFMQGIGQGGALMPSQTTRADAWARRNGCLSHGTYRAGHRWGTLRTTFLVDEFAAHPEWYSGVSNKLCVYEPGLIAATAAWVDSRFVADPDLVVESLAGADGTAGFDAVCATGEHTGGAAARTPSTRQATFANAVVHASGRRVAILGYGPYSAQPTEGVDPAVHVQVATAFMQDGLTADQVIDGYRAAGAVEFSWYSYESVWTFAAKDLPGAQRGSLREELSIELERLARTGVIGSDGDRGPAWGPVGRYYYAIAGLQAGEDPIVRWDQYPTLAFPSAPAEAAALYAEAASRPEGGGAAYSSTRSTTFRGLARALVLAVQARTTGAELERALDLARWAWSVELWRQYWHEGQTPAQLESYLNWSARLQRPGGDETAGRDICHYRGAYADAVLETNRLAVAAGYPAYQLPSGDLSPFNPPWTGELPGISELLSLL